MDPDGVKYYGNKSEIDKAQDEILKKIEDEDELDELAESFMNWEKWSQYDSKIPPMTLGASENYYSRSLMC